CLLSFLSRTAAHLDLHSFPTRRSSDLSSGDITLGVVTALADVVTLTSAGAITDTNVGAANVIADSLSATATTGIDTDTTITTLRSEEHTSELQSRVDLVCRLLLEKNKN